MAKHYTNCSTAPLPTNRILRILAAMLILFGFGALCVGGLGAAEYQVAKTGNDINDGITKPFQSIGKAASVMKAGDSCVISAGYYHETITPAVTGTAAKPISFSAASGQHVELVGSDPISGWKTYQGSIMRAPLAWDLGTGHNQVFCNGVMLYEAKFPKNTGDPMHPATVTLSASGSTITAPGLTQAAGSLVGGSFWGAIGAACGCQGAPITASSPGSLTLNLTGRGQWFTGTGVGYVSGCMSLLTAPGDWIIQGGYIYLWPPAGVTFSSADVEVKHRTEAIIFDNRQYCSATGFSVFDAAASMQNSVGCTIDSCAFTYLDHWVYDGVYATNGGIRISGSNNTVSNTTVAWAAGCGIYSEGTNITVTNCLIHDTDYAGTYAAAINLGGTTTITHSTLYDSGRDIVYMAGLNCGQRFVTYNDISKDGMLCKDIGMIYSYGQDGKNTTIAYNFIHDTMSTISCPGIYLDAGSYNYTVHHNVIYSVNHDGGILVNGPATGINLYNNTMYNCAKFGARGGYVPPAPYAVSELNDYYLGDSLTESVLAKYLVNPSLQNFHLVPSDTSEIDQGVVISGITTGFIGKAPDLGAFEYGGTVWTAGYVAMPVGNG